MTPREQAAFKAGVEAVRQMAMVAAVTIEVRDDAREVRQRAAAAALYGLAEGAKALLSADFSEAPHAHAHVTPTALDADACIEGVEHQAQRLN